jgi:hypothetical protein
MLMTNSTMDVRLGLRVSRRSESNIVELMWTISEGNVRTPPTLQPAIVAAGQPRPSAKRLIVLVTQAEVDEARLARRVWQMAVPGHSDVLYVALAHDTDDELLARRCLVTLVSITRDDRIHIATQVVFQSQWLTALRPLVQPGDVIVCAAEQTVKRLGRSAQPLNSQLAAALAEPIQALEDVCVKPSPPRHRRGWPIIREAVPFAIVAGFLGFQMWTTTQLVRGAADNVVLALSVVVEFSLIWLWVSRGQ